MPKQQSIAAGTADEQGALHCPTGLAHPAAGEAPAGGTEDQPRNKSDVGGVYRVSLPWIWLDWADQGERGTGVLPCNEI